MPGIIPSVTLCPRDENIVRLPARKALIVSVRMDGSIPHGEARPNLYMQGLLNFRQSIQEKSAFFAPAGDAHISAVDVRDLADVAVAALTTSHHDNKIYGLTGSDALTFAEMAHKLSTAIGRTITFVDLPPESMRAALADLGFPAWQADGLLEEFAMYRRGEAAGVESGVREALGRPPRSFDEFARDYAPLLS